MPNLDHLGPELTTGAVSAGTFTNYILENVSVNDKQVDSEDVFDEFGKLAARIIFNRHDKLSITAYLKAAAAPDTDFPVGDLCAIAGLTDWYVESAPVAKVKGAAKITANLVKLGITHAA